MGPIRDKVNSYLATGVECSVVRSGTNLDTCTELSGTLHSVASFPNEGKAKVHKAVHEVQGWLESRDYSGYEPFDLVSSPYVGPWSRRFPFSLLIRQYGRRFAGVRIRELLRVPMSKNCKALGLVLAGYCDLARCGENWEPEAKYIKAELLRLRSPQEEEFCWGYNWMAISLRAGNVMPAFSPNAVATSFCGSALLDMAEVFGDQEALDTAASAGRFLVKRLNRSIDTDTELCFSYTPGDRTRIYNSTALVSAFLTRLAGIAAVPDYVDLARRSMQYLINRQLPDGAWYYGDSRWQRWIDSFHTAYNLDSLLQFRQLTGETFADHAIRQGYDYYRRTFFSQGRPTYYHNRTYPIDIHSCSQAILTLCGFEDQDEGAFETALAIAEWTLNNMKSKDGSFYYQRHRTWTNRTPYLRWGQAWMFKALARLQRHMVSPTA
jgi:hypothetical protein